MPYAVKDRVFETSTTTGTGALTLAGAVTGYQAFSAAYSTGDTLPYVIEGVDGAGAPTGEWEAGVGTYSAASTLTRTTVTASSNAGSAVSLSAGTKNVYVGMVAAKLLSALVTQAFGSQAAAQPVLDHAVTWNASGVTMAGWKLNVTDTASASASTLMDLQVGGSSKFSVSKAGAVVSGAEIVAQGRVALSGSASTNSVALSMGEKYIGWYFGSGNYQLNLENVRMYADASGTMALRNGTNAHSLRIYNTFTDTSNYERFGIVWSSNVLYLKNAAAGTGSSRLMIPVTGATTVASLPAASTAGAGARAFVTDASATTYLSTVAGGGANKVPVVSDGTNWMIG